ncbi:UDP-N-acetylmuramoyl-tripeptide--D-alanyl-D-alanine ligase [Candidatus Peregrinibacteria bacterium]|nr:UDP-N-acetylmuramoyl-tripeptide--D-alanyl-D-alanine ligase [Candidatus Peregrinibacteria bacterium]
MVTPLNLFIAFLWFLSAIVDYADFCYIWQLKEYRWDRFRDFLTTEQGKYYWVKYRLLWRSLIAIVIFFWPINQMLSFKYMLIGLFAVDLLNAGFETATRQIRRPALTKKAIIIILSSMLAEGTVFVLLRDWTVFLLLLVMRFLILTAVVIVLQRLSALIKAYYIKMAGKKLSFYPKLTVIGITGSYGKTSVKNFLTHILSGKYKVISTPKNINTDIGVAEFILRTDFAKTNMFIVEMGAYKIGEIQKICNMVKPKIGILTAISEQHLSLFGDIKKTQQAKYELLQSLPQNGLAVVNCDNPHCRERLGDLKCEVMTFGMDAERNPTLLIQETKSNLQGLYCKGIIKGQECEVESPVIGEHNAMNIAPCFLVALYLGMTADEIKTRVKTLIGSVKITKYGACDIINDSYNSNPDGFRAALEILNKFPSEKKRIIITRGMMELGEKSEEIHKKIAEEIEFVADELVVITKDFVESLRSPLNEKYRTNFVLKDNPKELLQYIKGLRDTNCVILLENRIPGIVMKELGII